MVTRLIVFLTVCLLALSGLGRLSAETLPHISTFTSVSPVGQTTRFQLPDTHTFQYLAEEGDALTEGGAFMDNFDFTGYVPESGSSVAGYVGVNHELTPGSVSVMEVEFDGLLNGWTVTASQAVDFSGVGGTARNCSGTVTAWETLVTCEEATSGDENGDGYNDIGWCVEIDPATATVIDQPGDLSGGDKLWALGNFAHENMVVHPNDRTAYTGLDRNPGYLYKLVTTTERDLSDGDLYVFRDLGGGDAEWVQIANTTPAERNSARAQAAAVGARAFNGIEDVEISPVDGMVYFAVSGEGRVYRFNDIDPLSDDGISGFETYVGGMDYIIDHAGGSESVPWGNGNDNLAFDDLGNLWVLQDGGNNYIWVVGVNHTQATPDVSLFGIAPSGSEPTGITFTPDNRYLFMSIQHPSSGNGVTTQPDAFGTQRAFDKDVALVIARTGMLGDQPPATAVSMLGQSADVHSQIWVFAGLMGVLTGVLVMGRRKSGVP